MICAAMSDLLGLTCHPLNEEGTVALIDTPFTFSDGDSVPVFVEKIGHYVRFFDDGGVLSHFTGRGVAIENFNQTKFLKNAATGAGATFSEIGEIEAWGKESEAPQAFSIFVKAMLSLVAWESTQHGLSTDTSLLVAEVAQCLHAWKPNAPLVENPEYTGISGQTYKLDFNFDGQPVIAISPHHSAVGAAIKKMLDIKSAPINSELQILAVIDDRYDRETAKREALILDAIATVWPMTRLEKQSGLSHQ